ncbi:carbohydrate kinase [Mammaliicoccus stepanovicii]|uniref:Ribokinase n=1 Tax=Mammaliicoccus stepanovicii TaxID=643214 RepID=A0A239ZNN4_9STAP|nr:carbohydrate kinase [Mammaliicoccus stepanovicii]PNZ79169.1 carbohydrate kinase [Mammaliicoccus stepanovicii]GGI41420.1 carbohydrate kinase [Mammaliicoccus stepanovicii]SNV72852.1 ribokinase [Mammaliicoccus stepanovicii]
MNENEKLILKLIKENPFISQQELSESVGLSRPAVANLISGLVKKEYVQGKAYVLNEQSPIVCIGGANIDRKFHISNQLINGTSNPVTSESSIGGVARNVAENLGRIGEDVLLLTTSGNDAEWQHIADLSRPFMNVDYVEKISNESTGSYTALLDQEGNMTLGLADMSVYDKITPEFMIKNTYLLNKAQCIIADLNCPRETLEFLCAYAEKKHIKLVLIAVSGPKMNRMPHNLHAVDWLILNKDEVEAFVGKNAENNDQLTDYMNEIYSLGVKNIIVTTGKENIYYVGEMGSKVFDVTPVKEVTDVTGAGDAFSSALVYGWLKSYDIDKIIKFANANASKTIQTPFTVRQDLHEKQLIKDMEEL